MTDSPAPRRATCATCSRPSSACICTAVARVDSRAEVLVLMHPMEVQQAKNSGRLLHLCLPNSRILVGESFDPAVLEAMLFGEGRSPVLLYPASGSASAPEIPDAAAFLCADVGSLRLVALDATWRKSRKMLHLNPSLQQLPRLALDDVPASSYHIRKSHAPHQLSTMEAVAHALAQLGEAAASESLLSSFRAFVAHQASYVPHA
jgi:DTW domain-containing protein